MSSSSSTSGAGPMDLVIQQDHCIWKVGGQSQAAHLKKKKKNYTQGEQNKWKTPWTVWPHGLQHTRLPCLSPTPRACSNSCPLSRGCHPTISSSGIPFSSCLQSSPASGPFPMSQFFASGGQSIGASASASVLPMNIQDWSPLGWTGWISLQSKGLSRAFSNTTVQKNRFFGTQLYTPTLTSIHDRWKNHTFE